MSPAILIMVGLAVVAFLVVTRLKGGGLSPAELKERLAGGAVVVDVRSPGEFRGGAYPGAKNIPLQDLAGRMGELPKNKPIVVYCASGARSASAAGMLKSAGYEQVHNAGGLSRMPRS